MFPTEAMPVLMPMPISSTGLPLGAPLHLQFGQAREHVHGAQAAAFGVVGFVERSAPDGHHRVADIFIKRALMAKNYFSHFRKVTVEQVGERLRVECFGNGGEAANVAEEHGDFRLAGFHALRIAEQAANYFRADVLLETRRAPCVFPALR